jgi:hypothetical protein
VAFLGYEPEPPAETTSDLLQVERRRLGWTYGRMAAFIGVQETTAIGWATGDVGGFTDISRLRRALAKLQAE